MEISILNCNNIDEGIIAITPNKLNIKYGINGTGKSTITKAIDLKINASDQLVQLTPFKLVDVENGATPQVTIPETISSVLIFNEEYLNKFLYKEDELIANSYEIFIKTPEFISATEEIERLLQEIKKVFDDNQDLNQIVIDFENLSKSFSTTQSGLSKSSALYKGLKEGNKVEHIPENLIGYSKLIKDKSCTTWLDWQIKGEQFLTIAGDDCPYCTSPAAEKKETIKAVSKVYDKNVIKNFNVIIDALNNLGDYFNITAKDTLKSITEKKNGIEKAEEDYIVEIKNQIDNLLAKLKALKSISPLSFADDEKVVDKLNSLIINIELFDRFKSEKTTIIINALNISLNVVLEKVGLLQGGINHQKSLVRKLIERHRKSINSFLENAGYRYQVELNSQSDSYKLLLRHKDSDKTLNGGKQHLSFGEKNAFALVLFMYEALSKKPDLIILDDPISSFDKNKKYAIMHMLFRNDSNACLKNKTVMMLTHDLDPVIDTVKILKEFSGISESKLIYSSEGKLLEKKISKTDLLTFAQICKKVIASNADEIVKLIYLRRHHEVIDDLGNEYQVLSNLFHKRNINELKDTRKEIGNDLMETEDFEEGSNLIKADIPSFSYETVLAKLLDENCLKTLFENASNNYTKINIFRLVYDDNLQELSGVLRKFINESYHIENELICQLDPNDYELVPEFIVAECQKYIDEKFAD
jgi:energy-coupling factor transporter ATP-binding protein EcfA2